MIANELILLGLLKEGAAHGYDIKKRISRILSLFAGVEATSIYYPLRILEKKGLLLKRMARSGRRPQRFVYTLTPKGEARLALLLTKSFLDLRRPQFSLDLSLYFLRYVPPQVARRRLKARLQLLKKLGGGLQQTVTSLKKKEEPLLALILEHDLLMVEAESRFLARLIDTLSTAGGRI